MHLVQCRICHTKMDIDKETDWMQPSPKWYYHKQCYEDFAKKKGALKEGDIHIEADDDLWFSAVYDYLRKDLKMGLNYVKFQSQWKNFLKKGMTAKGIYFVLRYFYEIARGDINKSENGIGIVPLIYEEGTRYWGERNQRDKGICDRIEQQIFKFHNQEIKVILQKEEKKKKSKIDLSAVADMEEDI